MEEQILGACLKSRKAWEQVSKYLSPHEFTPEGARMFAFVSDYYRKDPEALEGNRQLLIAKADMTLNGDPYKDSVVGLLNDLDWTDISTVNVIEEVKRLKSSLIQTRLASMLLNPNPSTGQLKGLMQEYLQVQEDAGDQDTVSEEEYSGVLAKELIQKQYDKNNLIRLWPNSLNEHIDGGVRGGHHILVFAPTEMGKTLFVINMCAGFLKQGLRVLYVGNEDPAPDIIMRMMTRLTGMNKYEIRDNPDKADSILEQRNWRNFIFANLSPGTFTKIAGLVEKYEAQVVVLDQLRNIDVSSENRTQALEKAATSARNLAKRYSIPVISVAQAGDSATGRTILTRGDVDGSNVGIPGQCDLMIGIGADGIMEERNMRVLSFPKNKLSGRHTPLHITIDPLVSKVIDGVT